MRRDTWAWQESDVRPRRRARPRSSDPGASTYTGREGSRASGCATPPHRRAAGASNRTSRSELEPHASSRASRSESSLALRVESHAPSRVSRSESSLTLRVESSLARSRSLARRARSRGGRHSAEPRAPSSSGPMVGNARRSADGAGVRDAGTPRPSDRSPPGLTARRARPPTRLRRGSDAASTRLRRGHWRGFGAAPGEGGVCRFEGRVFSAPGCYGVG